MVEMWHGTSVKSLKLYNEWILIYANLKNHLDHQGGSRMGCSLRQKNLTVLQICEIVPIWYTVKNMVKVVILKSGNELSLKNKKVNINYN